MDAPTGAAAPARRGLWYYGWNVVAVCVLSQIAANGLPINCLSLFLRTWSAELHTPISQLLIVMIPLTVGGAALAPIVGTLADKYPARWLFGAGLACIAVFCLLMSAINATWQFWLLYGLLFPVAITLATSVPANAVVSRWFVRRVGLALGITAFGIGISGVLLPPLIAATMPILGWRLIWRIAGLVVLLLILPLVTLVLRDRPSAREGLHYVNSRNAGAGRGHGPHRADGPRWIDILKRGNFWLVVVCYLPIIAISGGCQQNLAPMAAAHGFTQGAAGMLLAALSLSHVAAALVLGLVSDRFGNRLAFAGLAVTVAAGAAILGLGGSLPAIVAGTVLVGFGGGVLTLLPAAAAMEFGAAGVGRAFGALVMFLPIDAAVPSLIAKAQESTGSYAPALLGLAAVSLIGGGFILLLRERRGASVTPDENEAEFEEAINPSVI